jgi:hypothetical protein
MTNLETINFSIRILEEYNGHKINSSLSYVTVRKKGKMEKGKAEKDGKGSV